MHRFVAWTLIQFAVRISLKKIIDIRDDPALILCHELLNLNEMCLRPLQRPILTVVLVSLRVESEAAYFLFTLVDEV